jgi:hypothetical protein
MRLWRASPRRIDAGSERENSAETRTGVRTSGRPEGYQIRRQIYTLHVCEGDALEVRKYDAVMV